MIHRYLLQAELKGNIMREKGCWSDMGGVVEGVGCIKVNRLLCFLHMFISPNLFFTPSLTSHVSFACLFVKLIPFQRISYTYIKNFMDAKICCFGVGGLSKDIALRGCDSHWGKGIGCNVQNLWLQLGQRIQLLIAVLHGAMLLKPKAAKNTFLVCWYLLSKRSS